MLLRPINNRIVLRRLGDTTITPGGIVIPGNSQEKSQRAEVLAVGPGKWRPDGTRQPIELKAGDVVRLTNFSRHEASVDGVDVIIMDAGDVLGVEES